MPNVENICGVFFLIFREVGAPHHEPHFTAKYGDFSVNISIKTGRVIAGDEKRFPKMRIIRKVMANKENRKKLLEMWNELQKPNPATKFDLPLGLQLK